MFMFTFLKLSLPSAFYARHLEDRLLGRYDIMFTQRAAFLLLAAATATAQQSAWGQCKNDPARGDTNKELNARTSPYYYQCVPGTATATSTQQTSSTSTSVITTGTSKTTTGTTTTATGSTTTGPPATLVSGYYWIRAVETPYSHSYLQAAPTATPSPGPGDAYLLSNTKAGQFNVVDGQLVYYTGAGSALLYMSVEDPTDKTQRTLETWFNTTENAYGTFAFSGDTLTWSVADIDRPNTSAWYVCGDAGQLYINTGAYAYDTPDGCYDETVCQMKIEMGVCVM
ncbi:hypothetical protein BX600DRAFT_521862 [Xylariales sp. PMI_506]|nr:hypothetical protein BX600DRAFT_521862 [Xylariales sp. PMI_506]